MNNITHWIGGRPWDGPTPARSGDVCNPATGAVTGRVAFADGAVVDAAVAAATAAARMWSRSSLAVRTRTLFAFRDLVERRKRDLAALL
ncbi:MAG TPA: aldehyde dehydrogenase family protein, partial [Coriobacteriia bacterium]